MPANRKAAITTVAGAAVTALVTLLGALHSDTAKALVISTALVVAGAVAIVFLIGWQKHEARVTRPRQVQSGSSGTTAGAVTFTTTPPEPPAAAAAKAKPKPRTPKTGTGA